MASGLAAVPPDVCSHSNDHVLARTFRVPARTTVLCFFATSALCRAAALSFLAGRMAVELDRGRSREQVDNCRADALLRRAGRSQTGIDAVFLRAGATRRTWALSSAGYEALEALRQINAFLFRSAADHPIAVRLEHREGKAFGDARGLEIAPNKVVRAEIETCFGEWSPTGRLNLRARLPELGRYITPG